MLRKDDGIKRNIDSIFGNRKRIERRTDKDTKIIFGDYQYNTDITRDGYTFKEWTGDAAGTKPYAIGKYIYNYMPEELYAQWSKVIDEDTYFVYPTIADQTYTGSGLTPEVKVTKNNQVINEGFDVAYTDNTNVGTATATVKVGDTVIGTVTFNIVKATPTVSITAEPASLVGGGTVKLTVSGVPEGGTVTVTQEDDRGSAAKTLDLTANGEISVCLSNTTAKYTFTVVYVGDDNYNGDNASCEVSMTRRAAGALFRQHRFRSLHPDGHDDGNPSTASKGETVTITTKPSEGYELGSIEVLDKNGDSLKLKDLGQRQVQLCHAGWQGQRRGGVR